VGGTGSGGGREVLGMKTGCAYRSWSGERGCSGRAGAWLLDVGKGGTGEMDAGHGWVVVQGRVRCSERDTRGEGLWRGGGGLWVVS